MESKLEANLYNAWDKMLDKLTDWLDIFILSIPNIIIALLVFTIAIIFSKYLRKFTLKILKRSNLQASMKNLIAKIVSVVVVLLGLFLILGILNLGKALNTILAGAGVAGLAVGLALQGALANTYSGIILSYVKQLKFGDWIKSNGYEGEVIDINLRAVTVKQKDNNLVYIPNKLVVENPIKNYSTTAQSRVILNCGVGYESNLENVKELVIETIISNFKDVKTDDKIIFLYKEFGDSSINFETRFWINSTSGLEVAKAKSKAIIFIKKAFDKHNINIPFPIRTLEFSNNLTMKNLKLETSENE
ncbi:mechanosensitive ion channel family protein [Urechidicola croceus]|uniref:Mechanosensitive ion channel protein MscS n=1 Tax=Urechidicola croceus TaxID=1850246 RepID=A0A1D8P441_9FLAO|nr:mechanosensitive ion channel [Urechidicola croceus]AOW19307.1 mechanosensitive ion channel protein MscS [Urechidicola croceus]